MVGNTVRIMNTKVPDACTKIAIPSLVLYFCLCCGCVCVCVRVRVCVYGLTVYICRVYGWTVYICSSFEKELKFICKLHYSATSSSHLIYVS